MGEGMDWNGLVSPHDRRSILAGARPELTWPEASLCPLENGDVVILATRKGVDGARDLPDEQKPDVAALITAPLVTITVTRISRAKSGAVVVEYRVRNDNADFMAYGYGKTTNPARALDDAEKVERDYQRDLSREASAESSQLRVRRRMEEEKLRLEFSLSRARKRKHPRRATIHTLEKRLGTIDEEAA
jgi:hypothetical protein